MGTVRSKKKPSRKAKASAAKKASGRKKAPTKKALPKKAAAKKALIKKAPGKKAPAKKTPAKKPRRKLKTAAGAIPKATIKTIDPDVLEFIRAIEAYKIAHDRPFPTWSEIMHILRALGYRKA